MRWGVFHMATGIHTAPCTQNGTVMPGHILTPHCPCHPTVEQEPGCPRVVWIHHDNQ